VNICNASRAIRGAVVISNQTNIINTV
jgi:hypothetical protein